MRANRRTRLLGGAGPDLGRVDAGRAVLVEHDLAVDLDPQRPHAGRVGEVPRVHRLVRPRDHVGERLGHEVGAGREPRPRRSGVGGHVVGAREREREAELLEHVGADAVGAERDAVEARRAGRSRPRC